MTSLDLTGRRFGRLTVLSERKTGSFVICTCRCDCGAVKDVRRASLLSGNTTSCGCVRRIDLTGRRFGSLTVLSPAEKQGRKTAWRCRCDCGREVTVLTTSLQSGNTCSCGCLADPARLLADRTDGTRLGALRHTHRSNNSSGVPGVSFNRRRQRWEAYIRFQGKQIHLGMYATLDEAAAVRARAEEKYFRPLLDAHPPEEKKPKTRRKP